MSASCSMAPDSRKSDSCGRLCPGRASTLRESCDKAITGMSNSLANAFRLREIVDISCSRLPTPLLPPAVISCR